MSRYDGTCWVGNLDLRYSELVKLFGYPTINTPSADGKVKWEWELLINDCPITIYDWKNYDIVNPEDVDEWHVGGHNGKAYSILLEEIERLRNKHTNEIRNILELDNLE